MATLNQAMTTRYDNRSHERLLKGRMMVSILALVAHRAAQHFLLRRRSPGKIKLTSHFG
jgi:hypothetical protein